MEPEYQVLSHLQENEVTTQRTISTRTGLSLGAVNLLLKKMARKGLIKIEKLNPRTVRYILTPRGIQEKASLTYRYIRQSYQQMLLIAQALDNLVEEHSSQIDGNPVVLYGPADEISEILARHFKELGLSAVHLSEREEVEKAEDGSLVLTWRNEEDQSLPASFNGINIMTLL